MKHAILITAYKNADAILELIETLGDGFNYYVHFDRKVKFTYESIERLPNVFVFKDFYINWGGFNHFRAIIKLSQHALLNTENKFFHLITAEDFPIKSSKEILSIDTDKSFLRYQPFPMREWDKSGGYDRFNYYLFYDLFNAKRKFGIRVINLLLNVQKLIGISRRDLGFKQMYGGSTYWSLNREALSYVLDKLDDSLVKRLQNTFCAEEFVFQSILLNSALKDQIINKNLRYIDWHSKRGGNPAFLDASDFKTLSEYDGIFARKIQKSNNNKLVELLKSHIKK